MTPRLLPMLALVLSGSLPGVASCSAHEAAAAPPSKPVRALWVTRWDYKTPEDVERVLTNAAEAGFDTVLWQVRGSANAFYDSRLEPWADELGGRDPGFDPLELALAGAHERGLALHAWFNVVPAWWGLEPPANVDHVYHLHPEWLWYDAEGRRQSFSERFYVSLNPCLPEVRGYVELVVRDLLARYAVDGLHLDYVRFPNEPPATKPGQDFPRDARTLALYRKATGKAPDDDEAAWDAWRAGCVTELVRRIRVALRDVRPGTLLSAAVGADPARALEHHQDWRTWLDEGLLDLVFPMNYAADPEVFAARLPAWDEAREGVRVVMGLSVDPLRPDELLRRSRLSLDDYDGYSWFGYASLWDSANGVIEEQDEASRRERDERRRALLPLSRP